MGISSPSPLLPNIRPRKPSLRFARNGTNHAQKFPTPISSRKLRKRLPQNPTNAIARNKARSKAPLPPHSIVSMPLIVSLSSLTHRLSLVPRSPNGLPTPTERSSPFGPARNVLSPFATNSPPLSAFQKARFASLFQT